MSRELTPWTEQPRDGVSPPSALYVESQRTDDEVPALQIGSLIPNIEADSTEGPLELYPLINGRWSLLLSFSKAFDPVATTEVAALATLIKSELGERDVKVVTFCPNNKTTLSKWVREMEELTGCVVGFPIVQDLDVRRPFLPMIIDHRSIAGRGTTSPSQAKIAKDFGLVFHGAKVPIRSLVPGTLVVIADPDREIRFVQHYASTVGRNFEVRLREARRGLGKKGGGRRRNSSASSTACS